MERGEKVAVVIPAYHDEAAIGATAAKIHRLLSQAEVGVVDDGSCDRTADEAHWARAYVWSNRYILKIAPLFLPLRIFLPVSGSIFLICLFDYASIYVTQQRPTNMSALLFINAILFEMMGLISKQITQLCYDRVENGG